MMRRFILYIFLVFGGTIIYLPASSQYKVGKDIYLYKIDSLHTRISELQSSIPKLQESRNLEFHNTKRELDETIFLKTYYEYLKDEDLEKAKMLVEQKLQRAQYRNDGMTIDFYNAYKKDIYNQIKFQRIYYQELFQKEKSFRKVLFAYTKQGTIESLEHAKRIIELSIKYATENQLIATENYLQHYKLYVEALIFDYYSPWDLDKLANNPTAFEKVFLPLVSSDSLNQIKDAEKLLNSYFTYVSDLGIDFDTLNYQKKKLLIASAYSDYDDRIGNHLEVVGSDKLVVARLDSVNPNGVYKWHDFIVVINEFIPKYSSPGLKKGEAIMESDKKLFNYIKKQEN